MNTHVHVTIYFIFLPLLLWCFVCTWVDADTGRTFKLHTESFHQAGEFKARPSLEEGGERCLHVPCSPLVSWVLSRLFRKV